MYSTSDDASPASGLTLDQSLVTTEMVKTVTRVLRVRIKDKHASFLSVLAAEVNQVWNYCNELSMKVIDREHRFLSGFDFWPYLKGVTRLGDEGLSLPVQTVQEVAEQYARSRTQHHKMRLAWRKSRGVRRSLGWLPFKVRTIRYQGGQVYYAGRWLSLWDSYGLGDYALRAGSFSEDSRGRWYLNATVEKPVTAKSAITATSEIHQGAIQSSLGIDLGLKQFAAFSDETIPPMAAQQFYRQHEARLAVAQRANKSRRVKGIHARIVNGRKDFLHQLSTKLTREYGAIFVGNVNAAGLAKPKHAKSVLDAGWSTFRTMLQYKCDGAGVWFEEVNEAYSTQTCSSCENRTGPKGVASLGIREWTCCACGSAHHRDINAAKNILRRGQATLAGGIPFLTE